MFSFSTPCLRWKLLMAVKGQYGWPSFLAPYADRYLTKLVVFTTIQVSVYGTANQAAGTTVATQLWQLDRLTGVTIFPTDPSNAAANADFPYNSPLPTSGSETWEVTDTYFKHVLNNGYFILQTEVTLSQPYDLPTLDADTNALLNSVSVASMPWNTIQVVEYDEVFSEGDLMVFLPPQVTYQDIYGGAIVPVPQLNAAAWYVYVPGLVSGVEWDPNRYAKLIGYIAMAGNYCQQTYTIDYQQNLLNETCVSGSGSCTAPFKVTPPPLVAGQNAYVLIIPNCQCVV